MMFASTIRCVSILLLGLTTAPAIAQPAVTTPPPAAQPVPGQLELSKLIWNIMAAVDHANQSGNYSVLRDMSAPGFQSANNPAKLAQIFSALRQSDVDLSNALLLAPSYSTAPVIQNGVLRTRGYFALRPTSVNFDLYFQWLNGKWRLLGVSITERTISAVQPAAPQRR